MSNFDHLIGLPFSHGATDCYSCFRRYYKDVLGITLNDYARPNDWWIEEGMDLYRQNFEKEGFSQVDVHSVKDIRLHDGLLIAIPDSRNKGKVAVPNHIAVYTGNGKILHHRLGQLSAHEVYRDAMRNWTCMVIRHKDVKVPKDIAPPTNIDIMNRLLPHKRQMLEAALRGKNK